MASKEPSRWLRLPKSRNKQRAWPIKPWTSSSETSKRRLTPSRRWMQVKVYEGICKGEMKWKLGLLVGSYGPTRAQIWRHLTPTAIQEAALKDDAQELYEVEIYTSGLMKLTEKSSIPNQPTSGCPVSSLTTSSRNLTSHDETRNAQHKPVCGHV